MNTNKYICPKHRKKESITTAAEGIALESLLFVVWTGHGTHMVQVEVLLRGVEGCL